MTQLLSVSVAIIAGLIMTRIIKPLHLPDVTAYLVTGVLIGPYLLGAIGIPGFGFNSYEEVSSLDAVSNTALGFIAFAIGNEFRLNDLKNTGKPALVIGILQALVAAFFTDTVLILISVKWPDVISLPAAITLGAIATATAPAATLMVVKQYKAKGKLTDLLLPIVALDDAVGLMVFAVSFEIAAAIQSGSMDIYSILIDPLLEIILSLIAGSVFGFLLTEMEKRFFSNSNRMSLTIGFVLMAVALSSHAFDIGKIHIAFSSLLFCMIMGTVFCNTCPLSFDLMERSDRWTAPLYVFFFVVSGAGLELSVFKNISAVIIGAIYVLIRAAGKYLGAYLGCNIMKQDENVTKNLGIALFPQAGVALGMCVTAQTLGNGDGEMVRNTVLFAILIYELIGPLLTKRALKRAGDITEKPAEMAKKREDLLSGNRKSWNH